MSHMSHRSLTRASALTLVALACVAAGATPALARGGNSGPGGGGGRGGGDRPEVRAGGTCGKGATSSLRVRSRDGGLETEFEVHGRAGASWRVTIVHEWKVAWRGRRRTAGPSHAFSLEYRLPDLSGADVVSARAVGPRGVVCSASATLPG
ncbi:MAG: hypothetical protein QOD69_7 [Solirubrobacteraceae bacterium]|jgi:hypothetical protein|nr:hypothetical protein [Solirubrobacteraceae bacterium]